MSYSLAKRRRLGADTHPQTSKQNKNVCETVRDDKGIGVDPATVLRIFVNNLIANDDTHPQLLKQIANVCGAVRVGKNIRDKNRNKFYHKSAKLSIEVHSVIHPHAWHCGDCDPKNRKILAFQTRHIKGKCEICKVKRLRDLGFKDEEISAAKAYCEWCDGEWLINRLEYVDDGDDYTNREDDYYYVNSEDGAKFIIEHLNSVESFRDIFDRKVESTAEFAEWFYKTQTNHDSIPNIEQILAYKGSWDAVWFEICEDFMFACGQYIFHRH